MEWLTEKIFPYLGQYKPNQQVPNTNKSGVEWLQDELDVAFFYHWKQRYEDFDTYAGTFDLLRDRPIHSAYKRVFANIIAKGLQQIACTILTKLILYDEWEVAEFLREKHFYYKEGVPSEFVGTTHWLLQEYERIFGKPVSLKPIYNYLLRAYTDSTRLTHLICKVYCKGFIVHYQNRLKYIRNAATARLFWWSTMNGSLVKLHNDDKHLRHMLDAIPSAVHIKSLIKQFKKHYLRK